MLPYLYLSIIFGLSFLMFYLQSKGDLDVILYNDFLTNNHFPTIQSLTPFNNPSTLSRMELLHKHKTFNLKTDVALAIQSSMFSDLLHNMMYYCEEEKCLGHFKPTEDVIEHVLDHIHEWTKTSQEREYLLLVLGIAVYNPQIWNKLKRCKQKEQTDTFLDVLALFQDVFKDIVKEQN